MSMLDLKTSFQNAIIRWRAARRAKSTANVRLAPVEPTMTPEDAAEIWFARLRELFVMEFGGAPFERAGQRYLIQSGVLNSERPYVFLQPLNLQGFLFERSGTGWVIGRAEHIIAKDTFMRAGEVWDVVNIVGGAHALPKVSSLRFQDQMMPFSEYRQRLIEAVRCTA